VVERSEANHPDQARAGAPGHGSREISSFLSEILELAHAVGEAFGVAPWVPANLANAVQKVQNASGSFTISVCEHTCRMSCWAWLIGTGEPYYILRGRARDHPDLVPLKAKLDELHTIRIVPLTREKREIEQALARTECPAEREQLLRELAQMNQLLNVAHSYCNDICKGSCSEVANCRVCNVRCQAVMLCLLHAEMDNIEESLLDKYQRASLCFLDRWMFMIGCSQGAY
jgi:hypothetical protein